MRTPKVTCNKCEGTGVVPLSDELLSVLTIVRRRRKATTSQIIEELDPRHEFHPGAFNNRLELLRSMNLVTRRRVSQSWSYSPV